MKKWMLTILLLSLLVSNAQAQFAGGSGTEGDPYQIETLEQLQEIRDYTDNHFIQIADIDASETANWNEGKGFEPIGGFYSEGPFTGTYDGNGYHISNLFINRQDQESVGLFGEAIGSIIKNVTLENVNIAGYNTGGLVGYHHSESEIINSHVTGKVFCEAPNGSGGGLVGINSGTINNSHANVNVSGGTYVGGLVGWNNGGIIIDSHSMGQVSGDAAGGLVGFSQEGQIVDSYAKGDVTGSEMAGGLVGGSMGPISNSYATGNVSGNNGVGGLVGENRSDISNSYSTGNITGTSNVGGLVGYNEATINHSYATGNVSGDVTGGLVGDNKSTIVSSYWDTETTVQNNGTGSGSSDGVTGLTTSQMTGTAAFEHMDEFDFYNDWLLTESYPALYWQEVDFMTPPPPVVTLHSPVNKQVGISISPEFKWFDNNWVDQFQLQVSDSENFTFTLIETTVPDTTFVSEQLLETETTYFWRVKAINESGESDWSEHWGFTTFNVPDTVITQSPVDGLLITTGSVETSWNPGVPEVLSYHVELAADSSFTSILVDTSVSTTSFEFTDIDDQQMYWWRVRAENLAGSGPYSDIHSFYVTNSYVQTAGEISSGVSQFTDEVFFTSSMDDRVYSFDHNGQILWIVETGGEMQSTVSVDPDGNIFVGSTDTRLYSFDKDGIPRWDRALGGTIHSSPSIGPGNAVYVGISTGRFFAFSKENGDVVWSIQTGDAIISSASIDSLGNVYFGSNDGNLYAVADDGELLWSFETDGPVTGSPALTFEGDIVFPSQDGKLYKVNSSGDMLWYFETQGAISSSPVIGAEGVIYIGSGDGKIYAISENGDKLWDYDTGSPVHGTPALTSDGILVIGSDDGMIWAFNPDGELIRQLRTGGAIRAPVLINQDNSMHISSTDGNVYIIENLVPDNTAKRIASLDQSAQQWSTFKGNNRRTGNQADAIEVNVDDVVEQEAIPVSYQLHQNYPNPFNPTTQISYSVPEQAHVRLEVYNAIGQRIAILVNESNNAGKYEANFDASGLSSGLYLYRLQTESHTESRQMMLVR